MSVFTTVETPELQALLQGYDCGELTSHRGISAGITNTNYFVSTSQGEFVLTLYEQHSEEDLHYLLGLQDHLYRNGVAVAHPVADRNGRFLQHINAKPAALIHRLKGEVCVNPDPHLCQQIGQLLAQLHLAGNDFAPRRSNPRGPAWWLASHARLQDVVLPDELNIIEEELDYLAQYRHMSLPAGHVHADLFHDNALVADGELQGVIDFDFACHDVLMFDLAVTINDWCLLPGGELDRLRMRDLIAAYHAIRPLSAAENQSLPMMLRAAALRFWLSRLLDLHFPASGELTHIKDPNEFRDILLLRRKPLSGMQKRA